MGKIFERWNKGGNQEEFQAQENILEIMVYSKSTGTQRICKGEEGIQICTSM